MEDTLGVSLLLSSYYKSEKENILVLASNLYNAQRISNLLSSLLGDKNVILFPSDELFHAESIASGKELISERVFALNEILNKKKKIVVAHPSSFLRYLPSPELFTSLSIKIKVGDKINIQELISKLIKSGYYKVNKIDRSLEFAKRGDIIDIFSINYDTPFRISLFDDEVESISFFNLSSQESFEKVDNVIVVPASDILFDETEQVSIKDKILSQANKDLSYIGEEKKEDLLCKINDDIERFLNFNYTETLYKYYGFLQNNYYSLLDYFNEEFIFFTNYDQFISSVDLLSKESQRYLDELALNGRSITHLGMYQSLSKLLEKKSNIIKAVNFKQKSSDIEFKVRPIIFDNSNSKDIKSIINFYLKTSNKIILAISNVSQKEAIKNILNDSNLEYCETNDLDIPEKSIGITIFSLSEGFELVDQKITILTSKELFNFKSNIIHVSSRFKESNVIKEQDDLKPGDFIVHEFNGIGRFIDITTLLVDGVHRDFFLIEYAGSDRLYVPLSQLKLIRKYSGREGVTPKLSSLSSKTWSKTKEKIKKRLNELTERLSNLYKERASIQGYAFPKDDDFQEKFNKEFPYELTIDQQKAYEEISSDMEKPYPMDRLLCGDVGFGKTEIAFRALFKCINAGKQAALLCPTTLLARQHYELTKIRFASFGIKIAIFSRLISNKEQKQYIKDIKEGIIHLIIGTHRLLSKEIEFKDLGLLVVDEEQRFGVEQKERIKEIKKDVDVLSLSATPIPRTLQMSLVGVRELSHINTAPKSRNAIQTYVTPYNKLVVKELIERELSRDGQIFFVHNNVYSIYSTAQTIKEMIPLARIGVVHGKMSRNEIEDVMIKFYANEINVLVATSIIENGLDVPNANMIIIENADMFGLAQLYQIKGRVGRSDRIAYAYLLYNENKALNEEAQKRLKAIQEFAELGSGYKIAQRDLMIRGAGDILGKEQAGFIDSIGIDLYLKMLNESMKHNDSSNLFVEEENKKGNSISVNAYIPDSYIAKEDKVEIYRYIQNCKTLNDFNMISKKIKDIYGKIPEEVNNLINKKKFDLVIASQEFKLINEYKEKLVLMLSSSFCEIKGIGIKLFDVLYKYMDEIKISYVNKELRIDIIKKDNWISLLEKVVNDIHKLYLKEKENEN